MRLKLAEFDTRSLGAFRIAFGLTLIGNWFMRVSQGRLLAHYTEVGVMPLKLLQSIHPRWSFLDSFSQPFAAKMAFLAIMLVYLSYTLGYFTKLCQFLVFGILISLLHRNPMIDDGSDCVLRMFALWTLFFPLGDRYSLDRKWKRLPGAPAKSFASWSVWFFLVNLSISYFFNAYQKDSASWHAGTALRFVFWDHIISTPSAVLFRNHAPLWLIRTLTYGSIANEYLLSVLLLAVPFFIWPRRIVSFLMLTFHAGIALFIHIGSFCYIYLSAGLLFISSTDWDRFEGFLKKTSPSQAPDVASLNEKSSKKSLPVAGEVAAAVLFGYFMLLVSYGNAVPRPVRKFAEKFHSGWIDELNQFLLIPQEWSMFRSPPGDTFSPVVEVTGEDGVSYDFLRPGTGKFSMRQSIDNPVSIGKYWVSYFFRIRQLERSEFRPQFAAYLFSMGITDFKVHEVSTQVDGVGEKVIHEGEHIIFWGRKPAVVDFDVASIRSANVPRDRIGQQPMGRFGSFWLNSDQVFVRSEHPGENVEFEFEAPADCRANLKIFFTLSYDYGTVRVVVNGKESFRHLDLYSALGVEGLEAPLDGIELKRGGNRLRIEVDGKNAQSAGTFFGVDHLEIFCL